jgi:serine/threonine-protein kinase
MAPELSSPPGSRVSHYEIVRQLGQGGMGVVCLARDLDLDRLVALKFLPPNIGRDPEQLARFRVEARAISALNHPHVATIHGIEETGDYRFLVLEFLPGGTLREKLDERAAAGEVLPLATAVEWGLQIAQGLAHAHRHGIVHRDIKASNVLFTEERSVKIADFGLAKILAAARPEVNTRSGALLGTPVYMAPEQARGQAADERSDVFSLGVLLYEMVAGSIPFHGSDTPSLLYAIVHSPAKPISELRPGVDPRFAAVIARALRKDPAQRYQNAGELARDLEGARTPLPIDTVTIGHAVPLRSRRWPVAAAIVLCIAMGGGIAYKLSLPAPPEASLTMPARKSIAVLPFTNVGGNPANVPLVDGLMELVSNSLTSLEKFHDSLVVVPAADVRKENIQGARQAGSVLGVNLAITGSVERLGADDVQVFLNLVDTRTVTQLRTESIRARLTDLDALQDGVVEKVARMLELAMQPERRKAIQPGNTAVPAAQPHYVEALGYLRRYDRPQNIHNAIAAFERAIAIDPGYAMAYAGAAEAWWRRYDHSRDPAAIDSALANASKALSLNDQIASVHVTMGTIRAGKGENELAVQEMRAALRLDPLNADAYRELGAVYEAMHRNSDAEATYRKAIELRREDWWSIKQLGVFYYRTNRYPEAERAFLDVIRLNSDSAKAYSNLGAVYLAVGRFSDATKQFERSLAIEPNVNGYSNLGTAYFYDGRYADSVPLFEKAVQLVPSDSKLWLNLADSYRWTPSLAAKAPETFRHAIDLLEKEIVVNPRDAQLRARLATARASLGEARQAIEEIERALQMAPTDPVVHYRAALVYEQAGRRDRALREVETSLRLRYRLLEIQRAPPLAALRQDPRFRALVEGRK